jgi:23S rRNA (guanine2445-N2)-methyltransferase / 23S rRNA (guanine2069-N7)-methyltransferase
LLAEELAGLGVAPVVAGRGGVRFGTRLEHVYLACLWSRVASRVLLPLEVFEARDPDQLYAGVHAIRWTDHLGPERTMAVTVAGAVSPIGPSHFIALKSKDAVVDRIRAEEGARPDVDKRRPDLRIHVHVRGPRVTVSLDLAGRGLHHRGLERRGATAPLRENLAAALLRLSGWPARAWTTPLLDPMCGSGTLLLEAAGMALELAPGLGRGGFGAAGWRAHDARLWDRLCDEARQRRERGSRKRLRIAGLDASPTAIRAARDLARRAGLQRHLRLDPGELRDAAPPWSDPGLLITNPPYGERIGEAGELGPLYELLGDVLKQRFPGWTAWVLGGNRALEKRIGLRPASRRELFNGPLACRFLEIPISERPVAGMGGPGWRKPGEESRGFARRLRANAERLRRWAEQQQTDCYRLYDSDVPTFNLSVDRYGSAVRVEEYERPRQVDAALAERRLRDALAVIPDVLGMDPADVVLRVRRRLDGSRQHERYGDRGSFREVRESGLRFRVNLTDYMDTGLFLDDRLLRRRIRKAVDGADFLNLFAYTCAASVAAAEGGARSTTSVDLSRTYLDWGRANLELNGFAGSRHRLERADVLRWLSRAPRDRRFGLIFVAPPTRSRSKAMEEDFEVQRDHGRLLRLVARLLAPRGEILFATNLRGFELQSRELSGLTAREITEEVTPRDFARRPRLRAWSIRRGRGPAAGHGRR